MISFRTAGYLLLAGLALAGCLLLQFSLGTIPAHRALLALLIFYAGFGPAVAYLFDEKREAAPILPLIGIFYSLNFGLPPFGKDLYVLGKFSGVSDYSLFLTLAGLLGFFCVFYLVRHGLRMKAKPLNIARVGSPMRIRILLWVLIVGHFAYYFVPAVQEIPSFGSFFEPGVFLGYGVFLWMGLTGRLDPLERVLLGFGVAPLEFATRISSGALAMVLLLGIFLLTIFIWTRKKIPIAWVAFSLGFFIFLQPVKNSYRLQVWNPDPDKPSISLLEKVSIFGRAITEHYTGDHPEVRTDDPTDVGTHGAFYQALSRISMGILFSEVVDKTPDPVDYWRGGSYYTLLTFYIPRMFWPEKPREVMGQTFGHRYQFIPDSDLTTSVNLSWLSELYANFGQLGLILGMGFFGFLFACLDCKFNRTGMRPLETIFGITILIPLVYQESNFTVMTNNVILLSLTLYAYLAIGLRLQIRRKVAKAPA